MRQKVYAQSTSAFDNLPNNVRVICRTSGSITNLLDDAKYYKSIQNVIVLDKENKEFDVREHIAGDNSELDVFLKLPGISGRNLLDLLELRKLVSTSTARAKVLLTSNTNGDKYLIQDVDDDGNPIDSTVFIKIHRLTKKSNPGGAKDVKFIFADAFVKFVLPGALKKILPDGSLESIPSQTPGTISCQLRDCPVVDLKLEENINDVFGLDPNDLFVEGRVIQSADKSNEEINNNKEVAE